MKIRMDRGSVRKRVKMKPYYTYAQLLEMVKRNKCIPDFTKIVHQYSDKCYERCPIGISATGWAYQVNSLFKIDVLGKKENIDGLLKWRSFYDVYRVDSVKISLLLENREEKPVFMSCIVTTNNPVPQMYTRELILRMVDSSKAGIVEISEVGGLPIILNFDMSVSNLLCGKGSSKYEFNLGSLIGSSPVIPLYLSFYVWTNGENFSSGFVSTFQMLMKISFARLGDKNIVPFKSDNISTDIRDGYKKYVEDYRNQLKVRSGFQSNLIKLPNLTLRKLSITQTEYDNKLSIDNSKINQLNRGEVYLDYDSYLILREKYEPISIMMKYYVRGFSRDITERELYNYFSQYGKIFLIRIINFTHRKSRVARFAFVTYYVVDEDEFLSCSHIINDRLLRVEKARPDRKRKRNNYVSENKDEFTVQNDEKIQSIINEKIFPVDKISTDEEEGIIFSKDQYDKHEYYVTDKDKIDDERVVLVNSKFGDLSVSLIPEKTRLKFKKNDNVEKVQYSDERLGLANENQLSLDEELSILQVKEESCEDKFVDQENKLYDSNLLENKKKDFIKNEEDQFKCQLETQNEIPEILDKILN